MDVHKGLLTSFFLMLRIFLENSGVRLPDGIGDPSSANVGPTYTAP